MEPYGERDEYCIASLSSAMGLEYWIWHDIRIHTQPNRSEMRPSRRMKPIQERELTRPKAVGLISGQSGVGANVASMIEPFCEIREYIRDPPKHQGATARLQSLQFKSTRSAQEG